ncbi:MAG: peptidase T [Planctomycetaceae bacterium]
MSLLDRFLRYVKIDTQSSEGSHQVPSTPGQLELCRLLVEECRHLGLSDATLTSHGVVVASIPGNTTLPTPAIAWVAHVDTSPETSGAGVNPQIHRNYAGQDLILPANSQRVIRVADNPRLLELQGKTIITTDGTTLLGADDKAGVAAIMQAAEYLCTHPEVVHGPIKLVFTCDEEIGHGVDHLDIPSLGVVCAYTLDGEGVGGIDNETFSADLAVVRVTGVNIHPSIGYGKMVNAIRILAELLARLAPEFGSPESTRDREGFLHPYQIEGGVAEAEARILLRDFETKNLERFAAGLHRLAGEVQARHPRSLIQVEVRPQYRNMRDGLLREPRAVPKAIAAMRACGLEPRLSIVRGGTDGSRLTELGLPCPNLSTGEHNPHSPLEWACIEEIQQAADVLVELAREWGLERLPGESA